MQSPAVSIQSPRPQGRQSTSQPPAQPQVPFDKQLWTSLNQLLNQLGDVERQGLVMFHKIEESFKHPYSQQEAIADTANLLLQLDAMMTLAKNEGFGALTLLPASNITASTPSASSVAGGTPKPFFMSPRMQNHVYGNSSLLNTNTAHNINNATSDMTALSSGGDISMMSPPPPALNSIGTPTTTTTAGPMMGMTPGPNSSIASPHPTMMPDVNMATPTGLSLDPTSTASIADLSALLGTGTSAATTPSASGITAGSSGMTAVSPAVTLQQMIDTRQKEVQALYTEKTNLKTRVKVAATVIKP
ncbi:hypothetical protein BG004_006900 [Podila humilis]|nr:hypothetical protein BG004_006900 [Podila humilis]